MAGVGLWRAVVRGAAAVLVAACLSGPALCSPEAEYDKTAAKLKALDIVSGPQLDQALRVEPDRTLQLSGVISGLFTASDRRTILLKLVDGRTVDIECEGDQPEARSKARVRCLVKPAGRLGSRRYELLGITADSTPLELLQNAALSALKFPPTDPAEIARSAEELRRSAPMPAPTSSGDRLLLIKRAIAHLNPKLPTKDANTIAESIMTYSARYGVDAYLVVAVIAAESRFNPNARSYKGAMGLGQLMPATAAAHKVDAYDPVANLEVAVRILKRNLDKYGHVDPNKALAAYNAGMGAVDRYGGVPPYRETRNYLWTIYEYWCWLNGVKPEPRPR